VDQLPAVIGVFIPIVVLLVTFGIVSVCVENARKREVFRLHHAERMAAIEKGIELPPLPERFVQPASTLFEPAPARDRRTGLVLLMLGLSMMLAMWETQESGFWWGLVPAGVGVAFLLSAVLESVSRPKGGTDPVRESAVRRDL
jgi:hypothetical protein